MNKIQRFIIKNKSYIAFFNLVLIIAAFILKYAASQVLVFDILMITASVLGVIPILIQAYQSLRVKVVSIDLLVVMAVVGAFIIKNYEESAIVTFLFLFGSFLEVRTLNKTRKAIKELTELAPKTAIKIVGNHEYEEVDIDDVEVGDLILVNTGAQIPIDGIVVKGSGYANEASITGESIPVEKSLNSLVYAGTILDNGTLEIKAQKVGEDTTFGKIIELVEEAQDSKSQAERFIDRFAKYYTPLVLLIGIIVGLIWWNMELAITILVLGCPGALVIGVPVSNVAGIGNGARNGVLLKGSETIRDFSKVDYIIFDKTGTLTKGLPEISKIIKYQDDENILDYLYSIELKSDHPLAKAVVNGIEPNQTYDVEKLNVLSGGGLTGIIKGELVIVGNRSLITSQNIKLNDKIITDINTLEAEGNSVVMVASNNEVKLVIGIKDQIRDDVKNHLKRLKRLGVKHLVLLSGDNQGTVDIVSKELELDEAYGNMLPEDKANFIKDLQLKGKIVAFVGDGINDSPSLAISNIGIAMGAGTDVAIETGDIILINSDFSKLPHALGLAKAINRNMIQNIVIALGVVLALLLSVILSEWMNMSIGMLVHEGSILLVIFNGMRLLKYKLRKERKK